MYGQYSRAGYDGAHTVVNLGKNSDEYVMGSGMQKSPKETYLTKKEKLLISKNLVIRKRKAFDLKQKAFDL